MSKYFMTKQFKMSKTILSKNFLTKPFKMSKKKQLMNEYNKSLYSIKKKKLKKNIINCLFIRIPTFFELTVNSNATVLIAGNVNFCPVLDNQTGPVNVN